MFDIIDDDEWFELSLALNDTMARLPLGSRIIEALEIPAFRPAIKAGGTEVPGVETIPHVTGQTTVQDAVRAAMDLASTGTVPPRPALTITVTQTDDGGSIAVAVAGLPGERCSFSSFDLRPGSHSIDLGFETLQVLNGWAFRSDRHRPTGDLRSTAA